MLTEEEIKRAISDSNHIAYKMLGMLKIPGMSTNIHVIKNSSIPRGAVAYHIGFSLDNKFRDFQETYEILLKYPDKLNILRSNKVYVYKTDKNYKLFKLNPLNSVSSLCGLESLSYIFNIRIKDCDLSSKVFGLRKSKENIVGQEFHEYTIEKGESAKLQSETYYITVPYKDRNIKFCLEDVEFIIPKFKNYTFAKDKTIKIGSTVIRKGGDKSNKMIVVNISKNKQRFRDSVVAVKELNTPKTYNIYAKHLKIIC